MSHSGSCLCGAISYEISAEPALILHCHCGMCRKAHGAAFATYAYVSPESFHWRAGEEILSRYESSPGIERHFCSRCGSQLGATYAGISIFGFTLATLEDRAGLRPSEHIFADSKAPWHEITDALPQFEEGSGTTYALFGV